VKAVIERARVRHCRALICFIDGDHELRRQARHITNPADFKSKQKNYRSIAPLLESNLSQRKPTVKKVQYYERNIASSPFGGKD
jgi:hypothetical protein